MSARVRIDEHPLGGLVTTKEADGPAAQQLADEAALLQRVRHPGMVEPLEFIPAADGGPARLVTRFVGNRSLATATLSSIEQVAAVAASVATTLADLHALGLTHGRVEPSHVLLDGERRPVLCSPSGQGEPTADVAAVGELLAGLLGREVQGDRGPERRFARVRARRWRGWQQRGLLNVADQARAGDPDRRPSARLLATTIHELVPGAAFDVPRSGERPAPEAQAIESPTTTPVDRSLTSQPRADRHGSREKRPAAKSATDKGAVGIRAVVEQASSRRPSDVHGIEHLRPTGADGDIGARRGRSSWSAVAAAVGVVLLAVGGWRLGGPSPSSSPVPTPVAAPRSTVSSAPAAACPSDPASATIDLDGDGCDDHVEADHGVVRVGDRRWAVGEPTDQVALGDWDCDGRATVALLRPATGEVFLFDGWARPDRELEVRATTSIVGAASITAVPYRSPACHRVEVRDDEGRPHLIAAPKER